MGPETEYSENATRPARADRDGSTRPSTSPDKELQLSSSLALPLVRAQLSERVSLQRAAEDLSIKGDKQLSICQPSPLNTVNIPTNKQTETTGQGARGENIQVAALEFSHKKQNKQTANMTVPLFPLVTSFFTSPAFPNLKN